MLEFRILGPLEVVGPDGPIDLGGPRQRALLAALVLRTGEVVPIERLVNDLWGESPPRTAVTSLQNSISQLRKTLGADVVETRAPGYLLRTEREQVDARRFERIVGEARALPAGERARSLREALALWRGDALADFPYDAFALAESRRLEELRLVALEERIEADLELGLHAELVGELEPLVVAHAHRERLRAQLMLALYRSGRQAEALHAYQEGRRALVDELGIDPSVTLQQLHGAILRQETALDAPGPGGRREGPSFDEEVTQALLAGRLVPVLGLTDGSILAKHLATAFDVPGGADLELSRVSQYVATMKGAGPLHDELHGLLDAASTPAPIHRFLVRLAPMLRERGLANPLVVTTHYDLALERAFEEAGEPFDVVSYIASGRDRGRFRHTPSDGEPTLIDVPNTYAGLSLDVRPVILKLGGQLDLQPERRWESFVVTEDDYIDYLGQADLATVVPVMLAAKIRRSHFLFLGYAMGEWSSRLVLSRLWGDRSHSYRSWAVQPGATPLEREFWRHRGIDLLEQPLADWLEVLEVRLGEAA